MSHDLETLRLCSIMLIIGAIALLGCWLTYRDYWSHQITLLVGRICHLWKYRRSKLRPDVVRLRKAKSLHR